MRLTVGYLSLLVTACGGGSGPMGGGGSNPPPGGATATVSMLEYRFSPDTLRVQAGTVVHWTNDGSVNHTSASDAPGGWNSGSLAPSQPQTSCPYPPCSNTPGGSFDSTFPAAGTYPYHCAFHEALGMKGVVIVTP